MSSIKDKIRSFRLITWTSVFYTWFSHFFRSIKLIMASIYIQYVRLEVNLIIYSPLIMWGLYALSILWVVIVFLIHFMCSLVASVAMQVHCYIDFIPFKEFFMFDIKSYLISFYELLPCRVKQIFSGLSNYYSFLLRPEDFKNSDMSSFKVPHAASAQKFSTWGGSRPSFFSAEQAQRCLDFGKVRYLPAHPLQLESQNENALISIKNVGTQFNVNNSSSESLEPRSLRGEISDGTTQVCATDLSAQNGVIYGNKGRAWILVTNRNEPSWTPVLDPAPSSYVPLNERAVQFVPENPPRWADNANLFNLNSSANSSSSHSSGDSWSLLGNDSVHSARSSSSQSSGDSWSLLGNNSVHSARSSSSQSSGDSWSLLGNVSVHSEASSGALLSVDSWNSPRTVFSANSWGSFNSANSARSSLNQMAFRALQESSESSGVSANIREFQRLR